jgi:hypothetical protein
MFATLRAAWFLISGFRWALSISIIIAFFVIGEVSTIIMCRVHVYIEQQRDVFIFCSSNEVTLRSREVGRVARGHEIRPQGDRGPQGVRAAASARWDGCAAPVPRRGVSGNGGSRSSRSQIRSRKTIASLTSSRLALWRDQRAASWLLRVSRSSAHPWRPLAAGPPSR